MGLRAGTGAPKLVAITVTGCHLILVICVRSELADLEQVQALGLELLEIRRLPPH
jgi:hypothetical protein